MRIVAVSSVVCLLTACHFARAADSSTIIPPTVLAGKGFSKLTHPLSSKILTFLERQAGFRSLTEAIDTTQPAGRMLMQMLGSFADYAEPTLRQAMMIPSSYAASCPVRWLSLCINPDSA